MLRVLEQPSPFEEVLFRCVDADEFHVARYAKPIEQTRTERRSPRGFFRRQPFAQVEIVEDLLAIVTFLCLGGIVIANLWADRNKRDGVPVRL